MFQVHSLQRVGSEDLYVLVFTDPNHPDHAVETDFQGSEKEVRDKLAEGELTPEAIDQWFDNA